MATCCEHYPCHENPCVGFSCQYCYCPLYYEKDCGGNPKYIYTSRNEKIKDCSDCMLPHTPDFKKPS